MITSRIFPGLRRDDLNVPVARQEFHVRRAVQEDFAGNGRKRISQTSKLVLAMSEAAIVLELAHARLLEVAAHLRLIVRVHRTYVVSAWIIHRHGLK